VDRFDVASCGGHTAPDVVTGELESSQAAETILVVEDEGPVRMAVRRMLERLGYRVREAANGAEALGLLESSSERIDLVLTDVVMPELHGRDLAEYIRAQDPTSRVLYMSGYTDDEIVRADLVHSGAKLLQKPFTAEELGSAVRDALREGT
jgi:two-component system cell cycle sensor histidine kinase/response regulator CckA